LPSQGFTESPVLLQLYVWCSPRVVMLFAIAALLVHLPAVPQNSIAIATATVSDPASSAVFTLGRIVPGPASSAPVVPPSFSLPLSAPKAFLAPVYRAPVKPRSEQPSRRLWLTLTIAQSSAATFDAWSTRRVISSGQGRELNPLLQPFAGNASLYAAIQVSPAVLDYVGRRMMNSRQGWARHLWWLPQVLGTTASLASGAQNLHVASEAQ
jgi:hypothetical protein